MPIFALVACCASPQSPPQEPVRTASDASVIRGQGNAGALAEHDCDSDFSRTAGSAGTGARFSRGA